ncbi:MBL fold metallo-hydrolase [Parasphingorhabdus sp.]|uniref:MBL fold metallo-hydrolase n=1 Tax=Parasphingorhabdus sp. TaxID=2709688 RepID=UPI002F94AA76
MSRVSLKFHGAAGTVTGSCFELTGAGKTFLVDCGMFQGTRSLEKLNYEELPFDPKKIDAVFLTHAHLDHSGRLAYLYASGCKAPTYCTAPTADILKPLLQDAAKLQAAEVERRNRRADRMGLPPFVPLYGTQDINTLHKNIEAVNYCDELDLGHGISVRFWDARHIVGSASVEINIGGQRLLFSGDVGAGKAITCAAGEIGGYDHIICESTYGDRDREPVLIRDRREALARHVEQVISAGGNLLIPAFALERTQEILEDFDALFASRRLAPINVFLDSPLAQKVTYAVLRHRSSGIDFEKRPNIRFTQNTAESKKLNRMSGIVIIAGSGMCEGGRIRHHLIRNLPNRKSRLLLCGFQVAGTLGSVLRDGAKRVRISGVDVNVNAEVASLDGYSNHADRSGLVEWLAERTPVTGSIFLVHGEGRSLDGLSAAIQDNGQFPATIIPELGEQWELQAAQPAMRLTSGRANAAELTASRDWTSKLAALRAEVEAKILAQKNNQDREKLLAGLKRALEEAA